MTSIPHPTPVSTPTPEHSSAGRPGVGDISTDVLIIGAGPAGSAAALAACHAGLETVVIDRAAPGRDKTCGDGLTPRAIAQLTALGLDGPLLERYTSHGLALHGFGGSVKVPWASPSFPAVGSACPRTELDAYLLAAAVEAGARLYAPLTAVEPIVNECGQVEAVLCEVESRGSSSQNGAARGAEAVQHEARNRGEAVLYEAENRGGAVTIRCRRLVVAEGVRGHIAGKLGLQWHRDTVYGIAARAYAPSPHSAEPWIHSHLELRDAEGTLQPGYGWIFPLGPAGAGALQPATPLVGIDGSARDRGPGFVNIGCGALSTAEHPAKINTKKLLRSYADAVRAEWELGDVHAVTSALLPMGGAVSSVAGPNWCAVGDTAACVNPLNGEGIDYALETGRAAVELMLECGTGPAAGELTWAWPAYLRREYGAAFALARRAARLLTWPDALRYAGPVGLRKPLGPWVMRAAARVMGNLVTAEDRDVVAYAWRTAGKVAAKVGDEAPLWGEAGSTRA